MNIREQILNILDEVNIIIDQEENIIDIDSIVFISLVIKLEETFNILIPDEFLDVNMVKNIPSLKIIINNLLVSNE